MIAGLRRLPSLLVMLTLALLLTLASFWMMMRMVSAPAALDDAPPSPVAVEFMRRERLPETPPPAPQQVDPRPPQAVDITLPDLSPAQLPPLPRIAIGQLPLGTISTHLDMSARPYLGSMLPDAAPSVAVSQPLTLLKRVPPLYPRRALRRKQQGWVKVALTIAADGSVIAAKVLSSRPARVFDRAALKAVRRWRFQPRAGAEPVSATQQIDFRLGQS